MSFTNQPSKIIFKWLKLTLSVLILFSLSGCLLGLYQDDHECDEFDAEEFNLIIFPTVQINYADGTPCKNQKVTLEIHKEYCSGKLSGEFESEAETDNYGYAAFNVRYTYKYANTKDQVFFSFEVTQTTSEGSQLDTHSFWISYKAASSYDEQLDGSRYLNIDSVYPTFKLEWNP